MNLFPTLEILKMTDLLPDAAIRRVIRAVNRQISEDFLPVWGAARHLVLTSVIPDFSANGCEDRRARIILFETEQWPLLQTLVPASMRASTGWVALDSENWSQSLSREALEMIVDPIANRFVLGPHPQQVRARPEPNVWHPYRVCKPVDCTGYRITEVCVANFVRPSYFGSCQSQPSIEHDFLGLGLAPFGMSLFGQLDLLNTAGNVWQRVVHWQGGFDATRLSRLRQGMNHAGINPTLEREGLPWSRTYRYRTSWPFEAKSGLPIISRDQPKAGLDLPRSVQKWARYWAMEP